MASSSRFNSAPRASPPRLSIYSFKLSRSMHSKVTPPLWRALEDGSEEPIEEADLYTYQRYRWLCDGVKNLEVRYRKFDLSALVDAAVAATRKDRDHENRCVKILKCVEGQYNKAFLLTMSNGDELITRLPNPNAGPAFYTVASEVATRQFLRETTGIPIPRIYSWSADASNPVRAEYIIEEKAIGLPLGSLWETMSPASRFKIIDQIVDIGKKLASIYFSRHGCIYYKSGLESKLSTYKRPESLVDCAVGPGINESHRLSDFAIGPSTKRQFWEGKRAAMTLDRGPWTGPTEFARAIGENELLWTKSQAKPRINAQRSMNQPETPEDYISLLNRYSTLLPYLLPALTEQENRNTISHPDLHLDNIFVDSTTDVVTSIIDWQSVTISPTCFQNPCPQMLELSPNPQTVEHEKDEKELLNYYSEAMKVEDPLRSKAFNALYYKVKTDSIFRLPMSWERGDVYSFRSALVAVVAHWDSIYKNTLCPVGFTSEELAPFQVEMGNIEGLSVVMRQLEDEGYIPLGGMVRPQYYEHARKANEYFRQEFIDMAEDETQKELHAKIWPYQ